MGRITEIASHNNMIVTYIFHSCFTVELENCTFVFDYFKDASNKLDEIMKRSKMIYILSSHSHQDHFNPHVFEWAVLYPNIKYILSSDIRKKVKKLALPQNVLFIKEGECIAVEKGVEIRAFGSTDIGVSFMVTADDKHIFHAGDLNNWHWIDESTPSEVIAAEKAFKEKLKTIKNYSTEIYLAFFPVDPRLGQDYAAGARQFVHDFKVKYFIPMHFWNEPDKANDFELYQNNTFGQYISINKEGDSITINK
ncbi:MAG: MBL fold metallo-hydrolase [Muribaculaceae bacterium]